MSAVVGPFSGAVKGFVTRTKADVEKVWHEATEELVEQAQLPISQGGNMHVETGYLRASLRASLSSLPSPTDGNRPTEHSKYYYRPGLVTRVIRSARYGKDTIYLGWTASYAGIREHRDGFMRLAAQNWRSIVKQVADRNRR